MSRTAFLTGATGFIGGRVARLLAADGWALRCLVRDVNRAAALREAGAELIVGDVTDDAALARGMEGVDVAFHIAAVYDVGVVDDGVLERTNVEGTRRFLAAFEAAGVPRGVYVSTTAALGPNAGGLPDFDVPYTGPYPSVYHRTKTAAHALARDAQHRGVPLLIICPAFVYGPGDEGPAGHFIEDLLRRRVPGLVARPATHSYVYADDVAAGLSASASRGRAGQVYVFGGEAETINGFAARVCAEVGRREPRLRFPVPMARLTGVALDAVTKLTGMRFPITREGVNAASYDVWHFEDERAAAELGYAWRPLDEGVPPTVAWFARRLGVTSKRG